MVWLGLAVTLAAIAALVSGRSPRTQGPSAPVPMLRVDLTSADAIEVARPDGTSVRLTREPGAGDVWLVSEGGGEGPGWPIEPGRVRALLRVLGTTSGTGAQDEAMGEGATRVAIGAGGDEIAAMRIARERVAGRVLVEVSEEGGTRALWIEDAVQRALSGAGPAGWKDARVMPALAPDLSRVTIRMPAQTIELARVAGRWGLRSPVQARADHRAMDDVVRALQGMQGARFLDSAGTAFPDEARIAVTAERDVRDAGSGARTVERWMLELGGAAPQGGSFITRVRAETVGADGTARPRFGPAIMELSAERLSEIPASAESYIARRVLDVPASDVGAVRLTRPDGVSRVYTRTVGGWATGEGEGAPPATAEDRLALDALVRVLAESDAQQVATLASEEALPGGLGIEVMGLSGQPLEIGAAFTEGSGQQAQMIVRTGRVTRAYVVGGELAAWLGSR